MATIVSAYDRGVWYGRCNASCYDGAKTSCGCVCGGVNHGVGFTAAVANASALLPQWIRRDELARNSRSIRLDAPFYLQSQRLFLAFLP